HELEISIPATDVAKETEKVAEEVRQRVHLKGFRAGKAPMSMVRKYYESDIRQKVVENLVPKAVDDRIAAEQLRAVSRPNVIDLHFHEGQDIHFKAQFEVFPQFEIENYNGVEVIYNEPEVTDEDVTKRIDEIRDSKATYSNVDPRPLEEGDYAVVSLQSLSGTDEPINSDEVQVLIGGPETLPGFTENLTGASAGDEKEFDVTYPEEYGRETLAGKTVRFKVVVKGLRKKDLPELNDEFAQDLGDFRTLDEVKDAVRKSILAQRQSEAERVARDKIVDKLVDTNEFPIPEIFVDRQIENRVEQRLRMLQAEGVDPKSFKLDWEKVKTAQKDAALREVKASLILGKVADRESINATNDEVDRELDRIAREQRQPVAVIRRKMTENGELNRLASHIQTEKTLHYLFEHATKTAGEETVNEVTSDEATGEAAE
ncbi:MAG TPA: trigger factor, partial [Bryobacteraceae bacterium]